MFFLQILVFIASSISSVSADLKENLKLAGVRSVFPGDQNYASASKAYNLRFTFSPAAVTFPTTPGQVASVVKAAHNDNYNVVPRGGGHSYVANGLGGKTGSVVVDMSSMKAMKFFITTNTAVIETGNRLGDVALALNAVGRALPHGTCAQVGIGGHTAFGGYGFTSRQWGLALDPIFAINAVLADGTIVRATKASHPDLFWSLKGAAPSFAITTSIEVNTFAAPSYATVIKYVWKDMDSTTAGKSMFSFQEFSLSGPAAPFAGELLLTRGSKNGSVTFGFVGAWYGAKGSAIPTMQPWLDKMPRPSTSELIGNGSYIDSVAHLSGTPLNTPSAPLTTDTFYAKSLMTPEKDPMTLEACTSFMEYLSTKGFSSKTDWFAQVELYGGPNSKIREFANDATSFLRRDTLFTFQLYASSSTHKPPYPEEGFSFLDGMADSVTLKMHSGWNYGAYPNYIDERLHNWQLRYFGANYRRLQSIKDKLDPHNIFMFPQSIELTKKVTSPEPTPIFVQDSDQDSFDISTT
ncbi:hypothetical protein D9757_011026 [Collybiopsis confluens]|uniref:FAD-binding PCMH-type domain-containing protein n=1 Tax=Collybiopsis confluens TaxID=2823264 RepID=A0A8H5GJ68_9AGAR|nr:hypothetical protein D9757_011026 [Collybiopsis confluens]